MALSDRSLFLIFGCGGCLTLLGIPIVAFVALVAWHALEPDAWREKSFAEDWVESCVVTARPASLAWYKTLDYQEGNIAGDADTCVAAYTITSKDFDAVLQAHKWVTPTDRSDVTKEFHEAWPDYKGEIESYYYDDGNAGQDLSGRSTYMAASADHTKFVFDNADAWARPFETH